MVTVMVMGYKCHYRGHKVRMIAHLDFGGADNLDGKLWPIALGPSFRDLSRVFDGAETTLAELMPKHQVVKPVRERYITNLRIAFLTSSSTTTGTLGIFRHTLQHC